MRNIFIALAACLLLAGCKTAPGVIDTGDVIDSQSAVTSGAATVSSGAATIASEADHLAAGLAQAATIDPALAALAEESAAHSITSRRHAEEARKLSVAVERANRSIVDYVRDAEAMGRQLTDALVDKERYKGQRNTAWAILAGLGALITIAVILKVKGLFF